MRIVRAIVVVGASLVSLSAASGCGESYAYNHPEDYFSRVAISDAKNNGASDAQIKILERFRGSGSIGLGEVEDAARAAVACMADRGIDAEYVGDLTDRAGSQPGFTVKGGGRQTRVFRKALPLVTSKSSIG